MPKRSSGWLERRGNGYRANVWVDGERHRFTIPTTDPRLARRIMQQHRQALEREALRRRSGLPDVVTMAALLDQFEREALPTRAPGTQDAYRDSLKPIRTYFVDEIGNPTVDRVQAKDVHGYLTWRRVNRLDGDAPLSNRTLQKDRAVLHRLFTFADRLEYRDGNPVARVDPPKADAREPVMLDDAQYAALLTQCAGRPMLALYVLVLGEAGLRCDSEALHLRWEDVHLEDGFLWIASNRHRHRTKSGKGRWVPMTPTLTTAMRAHFARYRLASGSEWVFHHERKRRLVKAGDRLRSLRDSFRSAARRAKLPEELHQHDLRHRRVTTWLAEEKNPVHVKEAMGHADLRTTMGYTHLAREHLRSLTTEAPSTAPSTATPASA